MRSARLHAPYGKKNREKYPSEEAWSEETLSRLEKWGFNLIAAGGSPSLYRRGAAHVHFLALGEGFTWLGDEYAICEAQGIPCSAFPNVFHPDFARYCEYATRSLEENKSDPWLFGYFLDNELRWWGEEGFEIETGLFNTVMKKPASHTAKRALVAFLKERYDGNVDRFSKAWKLPAPLDSFESLLGRNSLPDTTETATADKKAFVAAAARRYFEVTTSAIRRRDPNHMILGCRFAGGYASEGAWREAGKHCDVISFNYYGNVNLDHGVAMNHDSPFTGKTLREEFERFYEMGGRPMMTTEWSFPALDAGLPSVHGAGQRFETQAERTEATRIFAETILRMPFMIGYDYFMWVDEPALGISKKFPEDSNYGLVSEDGKPYPEITAMFTRLHADAPRLRNEGFAGPPAKTPLKPADSGGTEPPTSFSFERDDSKYRVVAGKWTLEGRAGPGPFWSKVTFDGVPLGWMNGMVCHGDKQFAWNEIARVIAVKPVGDPQNPTAVDLTGRYDSPEASFELTHRFTFHPDNDAFVARLVSCKNTAKNPLVVKGFFFRPHSAIDSAATNDRPIKEESAPRLWGTVLGDAWRDAESAVYWGAAVPQDAPSQDAEPRIRFWLNEQGGQHPDARWEMDVTIAPGETFRPERPIFIVSVAGRGDRPTWERKVRSVLRTIAIPK